jgi:hypothetical protein
MRSKLLGYVIAFTVGYGLSGHATAQPRNRTSDRGTGSKAANDKTIDKQMEWEKRVMGDDSAKSSDLRKIAAAQRLADEAAKHPPPIAAPKVKDPSKEGVRAKQEAAIGLPIASDQNNPAPRKSTGAVKKTPPPTSSGNDELGALVAASLAQEKSADAPTNSRASKHQARAASASRSGDKGRAKGRSRGAKSGGDGSSPSSLDQMFATSGQ